MASEVQPEAWDFWLDGEHTPALNMALDEALLLTAPDRQYPLLRFYTWDRLAVSIGYIQRYDAAPAGFSVVRRPTGGGIVYHDFDFTYTVVIPATHWLHEVDRLTSYAFINQAVLDGLARCQVHGSLARQDIAAHVDRGAMVCFTTATRYDVLADGQKIAGSAQRRTREGILHQGSIHFHGPLPLPRADLGAALMAGFADSAGARFENFVPSDALRSTAARLVAERYGTEAWNQRR